eukprot:UN02039
MAIISLATIHIFLLVKSTAFTGLQLMTDQYPTETSWELKTYPDSVLVDSRQGGYYAQALTEYKDEFPRLQAGEYNFEIKDTAGDGICCEYGDGFYAIIVNNQVVYQGDGDFGESASTIFVVEQSELDSGSVAGQLSGGSIFLIIVFSVFMLYLISGYVVNMIQSEERNWRAITDNTPHYVFWTYGLWAYTKAGFIVSYQWMLTMVNNI